MINSVSKTKLIRKSASETQGNRFPIQRGSNSHTNLLSRNLNNRRVVVVLSQFQYKICWASVRLTKRSTRGLAYYRCSGSNQIKNKDKGGSAPLNPLSYKIKTTTNSGLTIREETIK